MDEIRPIFLQIRPLKGDERLVSLGIEEEKDEEEDKEYVTNPMHVIGQDNVDKYSLCIILERGQNRVISL